MKIHKIIICFSISFTLFNCQNKKASEKENITINNCNDSLIKSYDSLFTVMSNKFNPNDINFDKSIKSNQDVDKFISSVKYNDICFDKSKELDAFVTILILKQYKFHLENYHQGYDLFSMSSGSANYIIDKYLHMIDKNKSNLEMLNSGYIVEFLNTTKAAHLNEFQKRLIDEIDKISIKQKKELK